MAFKDLKTIDTISIPTNGFKSRFFPPIFLNNDSLLGFKKSLKSISKWFECYCFYAFSLQNKAVQDQFHDFDFRSI